VVLAVYFSSSSFQVTVDEFIDGCAKLQGEATALETKVLHLEAVIFFLPTILFLMPFLTSCELISPSKKYIMNNCLVMVVECTTYV
jgi:hypothetical protein